MIPSVVGLDLSLRHTGIATVDGHVQTLNPEGRKGMERIAYLREMVWQLALGGREFPDLVTIEGYAYGVGRAPAGDGPRKGTTVSHVREMAELGGNIRHMLWVNDVPYLDIAPSAVKKLATGNGLAKKYLVLRAAERHLGYLGDDDNEADALWVRAAGLAFAGHDVCDWNKAQAKTVASIREMTPILRERVL